MKIRQNGQKTIILQERYNNMAIIKLLKKDSSKAYPMRGETSADYNFYGEYFSVWSYKDGDLSQSGVCTQNMQFNKEIAKQLRDALNDFLLDT